MLPYRFYRLTEAPDVYDIVSEGRKSSVGTLRRDEVKVSGKVVHNDRGYCWNSKKVAARRRIKRIDRREDLRFNLQAEGE